MLGIIGGTGLYKLDQISNVTTHDVTTVFGKPSAPITEGEIYGKRVMFLPRHGTGHQLLPSEVNYRANILALKELGVTHVVGVSAVGSLQEEVAPGDLALPEQYFDFIKSPREKSFFGEGLVAHVSTAKPTSTTLADAITRAAKSIGELVHRNKVYACVDGPRLGTKAESLFLRGPAQCDLVGMTNVPEVFLACEAQMCYCTIGVVTDYDCWQDDPSQHVTVEQVISRYGTSLEKAKSVLLALIKNEALVEESACRESLAQAVLTPREFVPESKRALLETLLK